jgi:hypothetical protein
MRLQSATFVYETDGGTWDVLFVGHQVKLWMTCQTSSSGVLVVENANRQWKPCQSHAQDLIRMHTQQPARCVCPITPTASPGGDGDADHFPRPDRGSGSSGSYPMSWREDARPIIARVIAEVGTANRRRLRAALRDAYPWGQRHYHPYRIWCHEIRVQLGEVEPPGRRPRARAVESSSGQRQLFG